MTKYLIAFLITSGVSSLAAQVPKTNDFEAELQFLEHNEIIQEEKAERLVEKLSSQNNIEQDNEMVIDNVNSKNSGVSKTPEKIELDTQELTTNKKIRRIPSR